jgi:hypothetical protein
MSKLPKRPVGRPRRNVPAETLLDLRQRGLSFRQIAEQTGFGYGTVRRAYSGVLALLPPFEIDRSPVRGAEWKQARH